MEVDARGIRAALPLRGAVYERRVGEALAGVSEEYSVPPDLRQHRGKVCIHAASGVVGGTRHIVKLEAVALPKPDIQHQVLVVFARADLAVEIPVEPFGKVRKPLARRLVVGHIRVHAVAYGRHVRAGIERAGQGSVAIVPACDILHIYIVLGYARRGSVVVHVPHVIRVSGVAYRKFRARVEVEEHVRIAQGGIVPSRTRGIFEVVFGFRMRDVQIETPAEGADFLIGQHERAVLIRGFVPALVLYYAVGAYLVLLDETRNAGVLFGIPDVSHDLLHDEYHRLAGLDTVLAVRHEPEIAREPLSESVETLLELYAAIPRCALNR